MILFVVAPFLALVVYRFVPVPFTPLMAIRLVEGYGFDKDWVPLGSISPHLPRSVIASEDNRFCVHGGFDWQALGNEFDRALEGERPRGASTISMQTVKNVLLWPGRDPLRKIVEAWYTPQLELLWNKQRILEVYLNIVEFGPGIYGAEAASRRFFKKPASQLSAVEAARLAAVLPAPLDWSAAQPGPLVRRRTALILRRIGQLGPYLDCAP